MRLVKGKKWTFRIKKYIYCGTFLLLPKSYLYLWLLSRESKIRQQNQGRDVLTETWLKSVWFVVDSRLETGIEDNSAEAPSPGQKSCLYLWCSPVSLEPPYRDWDKVCEYLGKTLLTNNKERTRFLPCHPAYTSPCLVMCDRTRKMCQPSQLRSREGSIWTCCSLG